MKWILSLVLFAMLAVTPALAEVLSAHPTSGELASACAKVGGDFKGHDSDSAMPDSYSCTHHNCDGNGGDCKVTCGADLCVGHTPGRLRPTTLIGILQNGNAIVHPPRTFDLRSLTYGHDNPPTYVKGT